MSNKLNENIKWEKLDREEITEEVCNASLTYWQDAWRRLKKNILAISGLVTVVLIILIAIVGPMLTPYSYSDQTLDFANTAPRLQIYNLDDGLWLMLTKDYKVLRVSEDGLLIEKLDSTHEDIINRRYYYEYNGKEIILDYSYVIKNRGTNEPLFSFIYEGVEYLTPDKTVANKAYLFGSDALGRDLLTRVLYGARISLIVAFIASLVNLIIGVTYGSISGFEGGKVDNLMMRIVDIINSIPLTLYVILLMVVLGDKGLMNIIIALGSVYWVGMARLVRGQILSLKEREFVLAAKTLGVSKIKIILKHLIPNAIGPIIVSMTMMIPTAVFTEAFLSFIGLGVSAPMASWGTLASDALTGIRSYPYQLLIPSIAIAITMLAFNFLGDGLRDALDPRLRK